MTDLPTSLPCSTATFRQPHPPHDWEPQPGMTPVHCPGHDRTATVRSVECPPGVHSIFDPCPGDCGEPLDDEPELTAEEARSLADDLGLQLYRAQDALAFVEECCDIADREQRAITTADVREWLKGAQCGRQLAADGPQCSCGGRFPLAHLNADQHQPMKEA
ncbi:hypothetical protein ABZ400_02015 [Streptomyces sp. NPDC005897]|uniref:hypothetical protein n=1 Tax=Streptomyces sp. NPDC005897 TaxID=3157081 RepID=UPI0033D979AA